MNVYVNYPKDEEGKKELAKSTAKFHAILVMKVVDDLNLDKNSKRNIIKSILEKAKFEMIEEEKLKKL